MFSVFYNIKSILSLHDLIRPLYGGTIYWYDTTKLTNFFIVFNIFPKECHIIDEMKTTQINQTEVLETYAVKFNEFEKELSEMMGNTVINQRKLQKFFQEMSLFFMSELTKVNQQMYEMEHHEKDD